MKNSGPIVFLTLVVFISLAMSHSGAILEGHRGQIKGQNPCLLCSKKNVVQNVRTIIVVACSCN